MQDLTRRNNNPTLAEMNASDVRGAQIQIYLAQRVH